MPIKKYFTEEEKREAKRKKSEKYRQNHKEERKIKNKIYSNNHKKERNEYEKHRRKTDTNHKLTSYLRSRGNRAIKNNQKAGSFVQDLGCSIPELKLYLESLFKPGMTWDNWSLTGWHIDHIIPLSSFDLSNRKEFLVACHYTNLQPLWAEENMEKRDKILKPLSY